MLPLDLRTPRIRMFPTVGLADKVLGGTVFVAPLPLVPDESAMVAEAFLRTENLPYKQAKSLC